MCCSDAVVVLHHCGDGGWGEPDHAFVLLFGFAVLGWWEGDIALGDDDSAEEGIGGPSWDGACVVVEGLGLCCAGLSVVGIGAVLSWWQAFKSVDD